MPLPPSCAGSLLIPLAPSCLLEHRLCLDPDKDNYSVLPNSLDYPCSGVRASTAHCADLWPLGNGSRGKDLKGERASRSVWGLVVEEVERNRKKSSLGGAGEHLYLHLSKGLWGQREREAASHLAAELRLW